MSSDSKYKLEYIWLDGYLPEPNLRGKTKIVSEAPKSVDDCPMWGFDGSSTEQAEGSSSDCMLKPVGLYPDSGRKNGFIVMCEVLNPDLTPHASNFRATIEDEADLWIGFEQEYFLMESGRPFGFPEDGYPGPQGTYYCGVGYGDMGDIARQCVEEHIDIVLDAGINHEGINAEVAKGQWEFQIFSAGSKKVCDDLWVSRYLLMRTAEKYGLSIEFHCKPVQGDWNGSGMHTNFSTKKMREEGGEEYFKALMDAFEKNRNEHIAAYGPDNHLRLTGLHETQSIDKFSWGVADRGASVRVPHAFVNNGYKGYLEDRRPNSKADPYKIVSRIQKTISEVG
ncbi:MAG: glutamine synthetase beta-grasp domain-containing protein [Aureliella sp.]